MSAPQWKSDYKKGYEYGWVWKKYLLVSIPNNTLKIKISETIDFSDQDPNVKINWFIEKEIRSKIKIKFDLPLMWHFVRDSFFIHSNLFLDLEVFHQPTTI